MSAERVDNLPAWVVDLVIALEKHTDEHPKYYAEYYPDYKMRPAATCGCEPLDRHVPAEVRRTISAIATDRARRSP